jgi:hypothetical protein
VSLTPPASPGDQLSVFGAEASEPSPADLAGLLAGPGQVVRMGGTARVSVVVDAAWRVHVLAAEFAARGLASTWVPTADAHLGVRTSYARSLAPLGAAWLRGAVKRPPARFHLDGRRLRLWVAAAGSPGSLGFLLRLGPSDEACWDAVGAALAAIGLPAVLVTPRAARSGREAPAETADGSADETAAETADGSADETADGTADEPDDADDQGGGAAHEPDAITGPAYRITGRRRLARLAELIGERPAAAPAHAWPARWSPPQVSGHAQARSRASTEPAAQPAPRRRGRPARGAPGPVQDPLPELR